MFDAVALGELLIDFTECGKSESGSSLYQRNAGGATANVMADLKAFGHETAFIGKVGNDDCGKFLKVTLDKYGINTDSLIFTDEAFTTLAFVSLDENGERSFSFARNPGADTLIRTDEIDDSVLADTRIFHVGSLSATAEPARKATFDSIKKARNYGAVISFDPNYRSSLWKSGDDAAHEMREIFKYCDIIKATDEEAFMITGLSDPSKAAAALCENGKRIAAVTLGEKGCVVCAGNEVRPVAAEKVAVVDTTGAGDSFLSGFLHGFLMSGKRISEIGIEDAVLFAECGTRAAAVCIKKTGAMLTAGNLSGVN